MSDERRHKAQPFPKNEIRKEKEMNEYVVEARDIVKSYGTVKALCGVDITVRRGDIFGLIGDNGAGKTTFLKLLTGQIFPTEGELKLFGAGLEKELERQRKRTGAIVETPGFYPKLSVEKNMEYYRIQRGIPGKARTEETLKTVDLWDKRTVRADRLSLGMKQRLGLAVALLGEPELLILDEPINGLDPSGIIEMRSLMARLNREKNITIIISSHILSELEQIATVYGFLSRGYLLEQVSAEQLQERCAEYIEIQVQETEKYAACLEKEQKDADYRVMPDGTIRILDPEKEINWYSSLAVRHGMTIVRLDRKQAALEEYYMGLKERGRQVC